MTNTNNETKLENAMDSLIGLADLDRINFNPQTADFINLALINEINNISRMNPESTERIDIIRTLNELNPYDVAEHIMLFRKVINSLSTYLTNKAAQTYDALNFIINAINNQASLEQHTQ